MAKVDMLSIMRTRNIDPGEFVFDNIWGPPIYQYLYPQDVQYLESIATSLKLSSKLQVKRDLIDQLMVSRGFKRFASGTNRVVYRHIEDDRFLAKIALDRVGMSDNPNEFKNQALLNPFVAKMFSVSENGVVGYAERVLPITNVEEFKLIADRVLDIIIDKIIGTFVMADIGSSYFLNWGIRAGFGPVLLDYPYLYKLDGRKIFCTKMMDDGIPCNGEIDYDDGFNELACTKCNKVYLARDLGTKKDTNTFIIKRGGNFQMKIEIVKGDKVIASINPETNSIVKKSKPKNTGGRLVVEVVKRQEAPVQPAPAPVKEERSEPKPVETPKVERVSQPQESTGKKVIAVDPFGKTNREISARSQRSYRNFNFKTEVVNQKGYVNLKSDALDQEIPKPEKVPEPVCEKVEMVAEEQASPVRIIPLAQASAICRDSLMSNGVNSDAMDQIIDAFEDEYILRREQTGGDLNVEETMALILDFNNIVLKKVSLQNAEYLKHNATDEDEDDSEEDEASDEEESESDEPSDDEESEEEPEVEEDTAKAEYLNNLCKDILSETIDHEDLNDDIYDEYMNYVEELSMDLSIDELTDKYRKYANRLKAGIQRKKDLFEFLNQHIDDSFAEIGVAKVTQNIFGPIRKEFRIWMKNHESEMDDAEGFIATLVGKHVTEYGNRGKSGGHQNSRFGHKKSKFIPG